MFWWFAPEVMREDSFARVECQWALLKKIYCTGQICRSCSASIESCAYQLLYLSWHQLYIVVVGFDNDDSLRDGELVDDFLQIKNCDRNPSFGLSINEQVCCWFFLRIKMHRFSDSYYSKTLFVLFTGHWNSSADFIFAWRMNWLLDSSYSIIMAFIMSLLTFFFTKLGIYHFK